MGWVYFIHSPTHDLIKIGYTSVSVERRFRQLALGSPSPLVPLGFREGTREDEQGYHRRFAPLRMHGEWFQADPSIHVELARDCRKWYGPAAVFRDRLVAQMTAIGQQAAIATAKREAKHRKVIREYADERIYVTSEPLPVAHWAEVFGVTVEQMWLWKRAGRLRKETDRLLEERGMRKPIPGRVTESSR